MDLKLPPLTSWRSRKSEPSRSALVAGVATGVVAVAGVAAWAYKVLYATAETAKRVAKKAVPRRKKNI